MKTNGIINSSRNIEDVEVASIMLPYFFVGQRLENKITPSLQGALVQDTPVDWDLVEKEVKLSALKDGQFFLDHQFGGNRRAQAQMFGAFLPLNLCPRKDTADKLTQLIDKYDLAYSDEFDRAIPDFKSFGLPIHEQYLDGKVRYDHALLKIDNAEQGISFLRQSEFRYVTGIGGMSFAEYSERAKNLGLTTFPNRTERWMDATPPNNEMVAAWQALRIECDKSRHIAASAPAEWKDSADFARWLSRGPGYEVDPKDVVVTLVYENYD
jgi:hypothetical protein